MGLGSDLPLLTRRTLLRALGVATLALLAGCRPAKRPATALASVTAPPSALPPLPPSPPSPVASPTVVQPTLSPDETLARRVAFAETQLVAAYDAAALQHPELASQLAPFRADHAAHANALLPGAASPAPRAVPSTAVPSTAVPSSAPPSTAVPSSARPSSAPTSSAPPPNPILTALAALESSAAAARVDDLATTTGALARLLASIGGCEAAHAALLVAAT